MKEQLRDSRKNICKTQCQLWTCLMFRNDLFLNRGNKKLYLKNLHYYYYLYYYIKGRDFYFYFYLLNLFCKL